MIDLLSNHFYLVFVLTFGCGLYTILDSPNLVKKIIGINLVQASVFLVFVTAGYVEGATPPILTLDQPHANPVPHAIVLTAIVVGVSLTAVALALVLRLHAEFGTADIHEIERMLGEESSDDPRQ